MVKKLEGKEDLSMLNVFEISFSLVILSIV